MTTAALVGFSPNIKAVQLVGTRIVYSESAFAELVLWRLPKPLDGSAHAFKYRLANAVRGECVLRYDNEVGKGEHRHFGKRESSYAFTTPDQLIAVFQKTAANPDATGSSGDWLNEFHPNAAGWEKLAAVSQKAIKQLLP